MPEVNSLILQVASDSVEKGADRLDHLSRSATKAERGQRGLATTSTATNTVMGKTAATTGTAATATAGYTKATTGATAATTGLGTALKSMLGPLLAVLTPLLAIKKAFSTTVELQDFNAQLKTATGSVENAAIAFEALEHFASETPYALEQSLEAFIKLTNLGLTPSEEALRSYGNTASAMGKDLVQLIEAVADATTGEFERLKEFGIKAKSEGDKVSFTFRGVTTTIGKNAAEIEQYLMRLGQNEFGGAMADRMATVGGQVSNLGDLWNQLFRTISEMGVGNVIADALAIGIDALSGMIGALESGAFQSSINSWTVAFEGWADDFERTLDFITDLIGVEAGGWAESGAEAWEMIIRQLKLVPAQIRVWIQRAGVEIGSLAIYGHAAGEAMVAALIEAFKGLVESAKNFGKAIGAALNPFDDTDFVESFKRGMMQQADISQATAERIALAFEKAEARIQETREARLSTIEEINAEFEATAIQVDLLAAQSRELRAEYEQEKAAKEAARGSGGATQPIDTLAQFKIEAGEESKKKTLSNIDEEEQATIDSYKRRLAATDSYFSSSNKLAQSNNREMSSLGKNAARVQKGIAVTQATIKTYEMANSAYSAMASIPYVGPALGAAAAAAAIAYGMANVAAISSTEAGSYQAGGIVGGTSYTGDNMTANVNSGEMILNGAQQARLFRIADNREGPVTGSGEPAAVNITVENYGSSEITVEQMTETDIRIIARDTAREVVREDAPGVIATDLQNANSRTSKALTQNTKTERRR